MDDQIFLALGSNIGKVKENLANAVVKLRPFFQILKYSSFYLTLPYGEKAQNDFANIVIAGKTSLSPQKLIQKILETEKEMGRKRHKKWASRIIDIDILFWGNKQIHEPNLTIPHYDYRNRDFFVAPAAEIEPLFTPPDSNINLIEQSKIISTRTIIKKEPFFEPVHRH